MTTSTKTNQPDDVSQLQALNAKPWPKRTMGYLHLMGPGFMQSAMTLGGGTAFASIFAGAAFGYDLIWVAPVAMLLGIIVLAAVAHQTLSTDMDPFQAMRQYAGPFFAWGWAISGIVSSIIWQFAQYALAAAMLGLLARDLGWDAPNWVMGLIALTWCISVAMLYGRSHRLVRVYEGILKGMVWLIVIALAWVVIRTGIPEPLGLLKGLIPSIPDEHKGGHRYHIGRLRTCCSCRRQHGVRVSIHTSPPQLGESPRTPCATGLGHWHVCSICPCCLLVVDCLGKHLPLPIARTL